MIKVFGGRVSFPQHYFSGTNCTAYCYCDLTDEDDPELPPVLLLSLKLTIGGKHAKTIYPDLYADPSGGVSVIFDSTEFNSEQSVLVKVEATCSYGHSHVASMSIPVKNRSAILATQAHPFASVNPQFPGQTIGMFFTDGVKDALEPVKYLTNTFKRNQSWNQADFLDSLGGCNVLAVASHGNDNQPRIRASESTSTSSCSEITALSSHIAKSQVIGSGISPRNSGSVPPFNLAFIMACKQGNFYEWADLLIPGYPNVVNQAVIGFKPYITALCAAEMAAPFFQLLANGFTVGFALQSYLEEEHNNYVADVVGPDGLANPNSLRALGPADIALFGDPFTKLHGVYTGDHTVTTVWIQP
jgi:hypothetical protein